MKKTTSEQLNELLQATANTAPGVLLSVNAPFADLHWQGAAGIADRNDNTTP